MMPRPAHRSTLSSSVNEKHRDPALRKASGSPTGKKVTAASPKKSKLGASMKKEEKEAVRTSGSQTPACASACGCDAPKNLPVKAVEVVAGAAEQAAYEAGAVLDTIMNNNKKWVDHMNETSPGYFDRIGKGQAPKYLYIGCSDARVNPSLMMGMKEDELFITRNVGNQCLGTDFNFLSVLEYSVSFLKVPHIIVCGHFECGAVRNAAKKQDVGMLENWLRPIRDVQRMHAGELAEIKDPDARHRRLVELNVIEQCLTIFKTACVQKRRKEEGASPTIHGLVFNPATGELNRLEVDFAEEMKRYQDIYDLY